MATQAPTTTLDQLVAFNSYPWASDREFMQSLVTTLGPLLSPQSLSSPFTKSQVLSSILSLRASSFSAKYNIPITPPTSSNLPTPDEEILKKASWLYVNIQKKINNTTAPSQEQQPQQEEVPEWQKSGGVKVDLSKKAVDDEGQEGGEGDRKGEYPNKFQAIIEAVTTGKTIEGIREIEEKVVRVEGVTPVGGRRVPLKPWERNKTAEQGAGEDGHFGKVLDEDFPPLPEA
ncbi:hypothetical protein QBC40DRAFT_260512 [Triangularia verruculosa]|uniref:Uncharacterized protein n=1 Tax=Triangularia verruculosa TaxID=2587418 RepID=A0AAN7B0R9_9PEZI|nr:hypothetical protein QBC40DRAFT_260512 [Triangularia verruculosa]